MPIQLHQQFLFTRLKKYIISYALLKILPQIKILKEKQLKEEALEPCTGSLTQSFRLLCIYTIEQRNLAHKSLIIDNIN